MAVRSLKDGTIYVSDKNGLNAIQVSLDEGNLAWDEDKVYIPVISRNILQHWREADQVPVKFSFSALFAGAGSGNAASGSVSLYEALTNTGSIGWTSTQDTVSEVYSATLSFKVTDPAGGSDEWVTLDNAVFTRPQYREGQLNILSVEGECLVNAISTGTTIPGFIYALYGSIKHRWDFSDATSLFTDAGTTQVTGDGDLIYQCNDKVGSANITQATSGNRPTYKTGIQNSLSIGRFATNDYLNNLGGINVGNQSWTIIHVVMNTTTSGSTSFGALYTNIASPTAMVFHLFDNPPVEPRWDTVGPNKSFTFSGGYPNVEDSLFHYYGAVLNSSDGKGYGVNFDGNSYYAEVTGITFTGTMTAGDFWLGTDSGHGWSYLSGDVAEVLIYAGALSSATLDAIYNEVLKGKWGLPDS